MPSSRSPSRPRQAGNFWERAAEVIRATGIPVPFTPALIAVVIASLAQVHGMGRIMKALTARGVPVVRARPGAPGQPVAGEADRYVLSILDPKTLRTYRVSAPMGDPKRLYLAREGGATRAGSPDEVFSVLRRLLGLRGR